MVGIYIVTGGVAGGIFFDEFSRLHLGVAGVLSWPLYLSGILMVMVGHPIILHQLKVKVEVLLMLLNLLYPMPLTLLHLHLLMLLIELVELK